MGYTDEDLIYDLATKISDLQDDLDEVTNVVKKLDQENFTEEDLKKYIRNIKANLRRAKARLTEVEARM